VESASLASVVPLDVWNKFNLPDETINSRSLSSLQLEILLFCNFRTTKPVLVGSVEPIGTQFLA
jgi:hypothetical protein